MECNGKIIVFSCVVYTFLFHLGDTIVTHCLFKKGKIPLNVKSQFLVCCFFPSFRLFWASQLSPIRVMAFSILLIEWFSIRNIWVTTKPVNLRPHLHTEIKTKTIDDTRKATKESKNATIFGRCKPFHVKLIFFFLLFFSFLCRCEANWPMVGAEIPKSYTKCIRIRNGMKNDIQTECKRDKTDIGIVY